MKFKTIHILFLILLLGTLFSSCESNNAKKVSNGVLNLSDFDNSKAYNVEGQWEFYWKQLLTPKDFFNYSKDTINYIKVNKTWEDFQFEGKKIGRNGYGTFHLTIIAPPGDYSLKLGQIISSYKIWINNEPIVEIGKVGKTEAEAVPKTLPQELNIHSKSDSIDIVIQVSNFLDRAGGIQEEVTLGTVEKISKKVKNKLIYSFFLLGAEFIFAIYFLFTFLFRRKNLAYLFFSISIFVSLAFEIVNGEMIFMRIFPEISFWELTKKIDFLGNYARLTFFSLFVWYLFKEDKIINKYIFYTSFSISMAFSILALLTPFKIYSQTLVLFMGVAMFSFLYYSIAILIGLFKKIPHIGFSFFGMTFFVLTMANDIMYNLGMLNSTYLLNTGLLVFFTSHSIILALNYSNTQTNVAKLSQRFLISNQIRDSLSNISSFNLSGSLKIINTYFKANLLELFIVKGEVAYCECLKSGNDYNCSGMEQNYQSQTDMSVVSKTITAQKTINISENNKWYLSLPLFRNNEIKSILILSRKSEKFTKEELNILEDLSPQIDVIFDNYTYFWNLENINKNLEEIIDKRTKLVFKQKDELDKNTIELDKKIEELKVSSKLVEDLNDELLSRREEISVVRQTLVEQQNKIKTQNNQLRFKKKNIGSSINYSKKIYSTIFSNQRKIENAEYFEFSKSKEIVTGDFWGRFKIGDKSFIGIIDNHKRNVTGTFLSFLILTAFEDIIIENDDLKITTANLLNKLRSKYIKIFNANQQLKAQNNFNISLVSYDNKIGAIQFSGAKQPLVIIRKGESIIFEPENFSIGENNNSSDKSFSIKNIDYKIGDLIYMFTDGYYNQIGEKTKKEFGQNNFIETLKKVSLLSLENQKIELQKKFLKWKGTYKQIDDVLVVGIKFNR